MIIMILGFVFTIIIGILEAGDDCFFADVPCKVGHVIDMVGKLPVIDKMVGKIPTIVETTQDLVSVFIKPPFELKSIGDEDFAEELRECLNGFEKVVSQMEAFEKVVKIKKYKFMSIMPDAEEMAYRILSEALHPMNKVIKWSCNDVVPSLIEFAKKILQGSIVIRKEGPDCGAPDDCKANTVLPPVFLPEEDNCAIPDERFCEPKYKEPKSKPDTCKKYKYKFDEPDSYFYRQTVEFFTPHICDNNGKVVGDENTLLKSPYDNSNTEVYQRFKIAKLIFDIMPNLIDNVCSAIDQCVQDTAGCVPGAACAAVKAIVKNINTIFDFVMDSIDVHDAEINNMRLKSVFEDRITIIHNQKAILTTLQKGILAITTNEDATLTALKHIIGAIGDNDQYPSAKKKERNIEIGPTSNHKENNGLIVLKIKPTDLYIFCILFIVCNFVFLIIGMVTMRYCIGYNSGLTQSVNIKPQPKYEYSPSEIEQINIKQ